MIAKCPVLVLEITVAVIWKDRKYVLDTINAIL